MSNSVVNVGDMDEEALLPMQCDLRTTSSSESDSEAVSYVRIRCERFIQQVGELTTAVQAAAIDLPARFTNKGEDWRITALSAVVTAAFLITAIATLCNYTPVFNVYVTIYDDQADSLASSMDSGSPFKLLSLAGIMTGGNQEVYWPRLDPSKHCPLLPQAPYGVKDGVQRHYPYPQNYSRAECLCTPVHNFALISMQRSGSGWFETFLNSHPNVSSHGEVFHKPAVRANVSMTLRTLDLVYNLDWNNSAAKNSCTSAVGLKWMLNQGITDYRSDVLQYLRSKHVSIILLLRRNLLRRMVSILANSYDAKMRILDGEHKAHVNTEEEAVKLASYRPHLNTSHLVDNLERLKEMMEEAQTLLKGMRVMTVYYEDVVQNRTILQDVQQFLEVPIQPLTSSQVKIHSMPLNETINNYEDVATTLKDTKFEKFLADDI